MRQIAKQIHHAILSARHILLVPHQHPDGDALGSCTAFMEFLTNTKRSHAAFCATGISPRLSFLPQAARVMNDPALWDHPELDVLVVFDSGDLRYAGIEAAVRAREKKLKIIVIDHHVTNERYGDIHLIDHTASSTAELVYHFFQANDITVTPRMATALLTGILTDTDNFTNAATSASALTVGNHLLRAGADAGHIAASVFRDKTISTLRLWGIMLSRLTREETANLVFTYITQQDLQATGTAESDIEGMANYMNMIDETPVTLILKELTDGSCKGSFRTTKDDVDVAAMAKSLGGGGHRKAAGFTIPGPVNRAITEVVAAINAVQKERPSVYS